MTSTAEQKNFSRKTTQKPHRHRVTAYFFFLIKDKPGAVFLKLAGFQLTRNSLKREAVNPVPALPCTKSHRAILKP